jgi:hypothetical protein
MKKCLGEFDPALQAAGQRFHQIARTFGQSEPTKHRGATLAQILAFEPKQMPMMHQVFTNRKLAVDARMLKNDADSPAQRARLGAQIAIKDAGLA